MKHCTQSQIGNHSVPYGAYIGDLEATNEFEVAKSTRMMSYALRTNKDNGSSAMVARHRRTRGNGNVGSYDVQGGGGGICMIGRCSVIRLS